MFVPQAFISMYLPAVYAGLIVGFIGTMAIAINRRELHILILTDIVGLAMIFVVSAVGTDLAEALILPGLVVELAETLAISEILITREMRKIEQDPRANLTKSSSIFPQAFSLDMEYSSLVLLEEQLLVEELCCMHYLKKQEDFRY